MLNPLLQHFICIFQFYDLLCLSGIQGLLLHGKENQDRGPVPGLDPDLGRDLRLGPGQGPDHGQGLEVVEGRCYCFLTFCML